MAHTLVTTTTAEKNIFELATSKHEAEQQKLISMLSDLKEQYFSLKVLKRIESQTKNPSIRHLARMRSHLEQGQMSASEVEANNTATGNDLVQSRAKTFTAQFQHVTKQQSFADILRAQGLTLKTQNEVVAVNNKKKVTP